MAWRFLLPGLLALGILSLAPVLGEVRDLLVRAWGPRSAPLLLGFFGFFAGLMVLLSVLVVARRDRLAWGRWLALAAGFGSAVAVLGLFATGQPLVDAVERAHLLAYGGLAYSLAWAARPAGLAGSLTLAALGACLVAVLDEFLQWWVALRVGEIRDVGLNAASSACGLLVALAHHRSPGSGPLVATRRAAGSLAAGVGLLLAVFVESVHLGHWQELEPEVRFRSRFRAGKLEELSRERAQRWAARPPWSRSPWSPEDHFLSEARAHLAHRNAARGIGDARSAMREQWILEHRFRPVLSLISPETGEPLDWPPEVRAAIFLQAGGESGLRGKSPVLRGRVWTSEPLRWGLWTAALLLAGAAIRIGFRPERRRG